jgi:hypothetical protein
MAEQTKEDGPPQPILISGGPVEPSVNDAQPSPTNSLAQAIERYESLKSTSDPGNFFAVFGLVLMVVSLFIGVSAAMDGLFNGGSGDGVELCFGGLFIGLLVSVGGVAKSASHQGQLKKALAEIKSLANLPEKKTTSPFLAPGPILIALGALLIMFWDLIGLLMLLGGLGTLLVGALTGSTSEKPEHVLAAAKEVLRRNE